MKKNYKLLISSLFLLGLLILVFFGPSLPFVDSGLKQHKMLHTKAEGFLLPPYAPRTDFPLGSDHYGVDILSVIIMGAKETIALVLLIVAIRYLLSIPLAVAGFYSKWMERFLIGWQQLFSFMPPIFFVAFFVTLPIIFFSDNRALWMILVLAFLESGRVAEILLRHMQETSKKPYIEAGIVCGTPPLQMFKNYYFPVLVPHIIILMINDMGRVLFLIAQLGVVQIYISHKFISNEGRGYDIVNTSLAWPVLFRKITEDIFLYQWIPFSVIGAIALTIFIFNMFADGMQKFFEKKYRTYRTDL